MSSGSTAVREEPPTMKEHEEFERLLVIMNVRRLAQKLVDWIGHVGLKLLRETQVV